MAYIQDISVLMRELLKVPKDYTPTAIEISRYIRSRYSNDHTENARKTRAKVPIGTRAFSSVSRSAPPSLVQDNQERHTTQQVRPSQQTQMPLRLVNRHQKMSGRSLTYSSLQPSEKPKQQPSVRNTKNFPGKVGKRDFTTTALRKASTRKKVQTRAAWDPRPRTAPPPIGPPPVAETQLANRQSFWNWQSAKNQIRRAMSDLVVSSRTQTKNKLAMLSERIKEDPRTETKRRDTLKEMVDPDITRREPVRTREIIQRLLEENKLEDQRREIARLTELARSKVMEARKSELISTNGNKRHDDSF